MTTCRTQLQLRQRVILRPQARARRQRLAAVGSLRDLRTTEDSVLSEELLDARRAADAKYNGPISWLEAELERKERTTAAFEENEF